MPKPVIKLYDHVGTGLIFPWPSGVLYSNQTGGFSCLQPEMEGIFVPLGNSVEIPSQVLISKEAQLFHYFSHAPWHGRGATSGLTTQDADFIDALLRRPPALDYIRVDRDRLSESHEAWVQVVVAPDTDDAELSLFSGLAPFPRSAILTWTNTD